MKHRIFIILMLITLMLSTLIVRLFWLQAFESHAAAYSNDIVQKSVLQRRQSLVLDDGRADFYDRNMHALTGKKEPSLAIFPLHEADRADEQQLRAVAKSLNVKLESLMNYLDRLQQPELWPERLNDVQIATLQALKAPGFIVVPSKVRYVEPYIASHLIGFVSQHPERLKQRYAEQLQNGRLTIDSMIGASGLELSLDSMLHGVEATTLTLYTDAHNRLLQGLRTRIQYPQHDRYPLKVVLTIDKHIQQHIETIFETLNIHEGAAVVLDASNADVVSLVSRPQFQPDHIHLTDNNWSNKALQAMVPGSFFKAVVAAAALEGRHVSSSEVFQCHGSYSHRSLGAYRLPCWNKAGHGKLTLERAFAQSCNVAFAQVMERIPTHELQLAAHKLGLAQQIGWGKLPDKHQKQHILQFYGEEAGQLFAPGTPQDDVGVRAQTSIGQRDVLITPLQAANLVVTLLRDGEVKRPRVVQSLRYNNNRLMRSFPTQTFIKRHKGISTRTARALRHWMEETVASGTGSMLNSAHWQLAGKSGTAQWTARGRQMLNQWFIGYGPVQSPRYAVAVLVQREGSEADHHHVATELFGQIMNALAERSTKK